MRFIPDEFLFMRGCVWMGWNLWVCVCVCVCVQGWISPPSLFLFILSTRFNRCAFNRPGCCAGCPTKGGLPGPQPRCPHRSGRCLAPFWLPLGVTKTQHTKILTLLLLRASSDPSCCSSCSPFSSPVFIPLF